MTTHADEMPPVTKEECERRGIPYPFIDRDLYHGRNIIEGAKPKFHIHKEVYVTTIYDEMSKMTEAEIEEWKRNNVSKRLRHALQSAREIEHLFEDLDNAGYEMITLLTQITAVRTAIEKVINGKGRSE